MSDAGDTFEIGGVTYRAGRLNAIKQLHVVRRLAPLIGSLKGADLRGAMTPALTDDEKAKQTAAMLTLLEPLAEAVAGMSDEATEYVLAACLGVCQRQMPGGLGWSPVWGEQARRPMFDDISMPSMMQLVGKVLVQNVGDFTSALSRTTPAAA